MVQRLLFVFLIAFVASTIGAQPYDFRHYQVENGLSNNAVICSVQDKAGFLWFGTKDGLNRFDGYTFKVFRNNPDDSSSIGSNFIYALFVDKKGTMWIGTEKGLYQYHAASESFSQVKAIGNFPISEITADDRGNIWFISGLTLYKYSIGTSNVITYTPQLFFESTGVCVSPSGDVWVATSNGLLKKYIPDGNRFASFDVFGSLRPGATRWIEKIQATNEGTILVGTGTSGAKVFDPSSGTYKNIPLLQKGQTELFVRSFLQSSANEWWIGTESGVFIYNTGTGLATNLQKKYNDPYSLSDNAVYTFCRDKEGGIWAGTYFGGVNYYPQPHTPFRRMIPKSGENSLSGNVVREIRKDNSGNLWIGTEDAGLNKWDASAKRFIHFLPTGLPTGISYTNIHGLLLTGDELWIGTFEHGLDVMNIKTGKVVRHYSSSNQPALQSNFIYCLYETKEGEILIGTTIAVYRYNRSADRIEPLPGMPVYNWYTGIFKDAAGTIWATTFGNGINYLNTKTGKTGNFRYNAADRYSVSSDRINALFEDSEKNLWFATENGLCKWNAELRNFKRYSTADGLPSNFVMSILEDDAKQLWLSTTKGLVAFDPHTGKMKVYTIANGLLSDQFNFSSAYKDADGRMYFGSAKGLVSFHPSEFKTNTFTPPVYITGFQINNKDIVIAQAGSPLKNAITFTKSITLKHNQATFSIDFAALSYTAPEMLEYAYRLEGLSSDWTYLKKNQKVYFTELKAGTYVFNVKAANSSGIWNKEVTRLVIKILPPWWKSWWAYSAYALALLMAALLLVRNYHRRMQERARRNMERLQIAKEKEIYEAKMDFFTNVAHEIRTPLTLIKGPLEKVIRLAGGMAEIKTSLKIMERNTARLIELTNQLLDFRKTEIRGVRLSFAETNISELLEEVHQGFSTLAEQKAVRITLNLPPSPVRAFVDAEALTKIIYNLCSNAVKYADSFAEVNLLHPKPDAHTFIIQVKNDGYLIPESVGEKIFEPFFRLKETDKQKGTGIGLALSRSLAELHNGSLVLEKPDGNLNIFTLAMPIHQEVNLTGAVYKSSPGAITATK